MHFGVPLFSETSIYTSQMDTSWVCFLEVRGRVPAATGSLPPGTSRRIRIPPPCQCGSGITATVFRRNRDPTYRSSFDSWPVNLPPLTYFCQKEGFNKALFLEGLRWGWGAIILIDTVDGPDGRNSACTSWGTRFYTSQVVQDFFDQPYFMMILRVSCVWSTPPENSGPLKMMLGRWMFSFGFRPTFRSFCFWF